MKPSYTRIFAGLGVALLGSLLLLDSLNINGFNNLLTTWWPLFVIGAGILVLMNDLRNYLWVVLIIGFGGLYQLNNLNIVDVNPWQLFWPAAIIVVGLSIIFRIPRNHVRIAPNDSDDAAAILGGVDHINSSEDYKGGKVTVVMGGVKLDLRKITIKKEATLDIFALMGGVELWLPENVVVRSKAAAILGGIDNKSQTSESANAPVLYITGQVVMAGIEIKR